MAGSFFDSIVRSHLDAPVDEVFGEPIVLIPWRSTPNGVGTPDPERAVVRCTAVFTRRPRRTDIPTGNRPASGRGGHDFRTLVEGNLPRLSVPDAAFSPGAAPRQGDRVDIHGKRYVIVSAAHDSVSRYKLELVSA